MQGLGVWPGPVRQVEGGEVRVNGSNNVFGAEEDNTPGSDDLIATAYPVSLPVPHSISPVLKRDIIPEYHPLYPVRPVRTPAMAAVCATSSDHRNLAGRAVGDVVVEPLP